MKEPRNPFRLRASEHIESEATFVRLFGPGALDVFRETSSLFESLLIIRSAPGGGKSSLMRLMTPSALLTLHAYRSRDECKELHQQMTRFGVMSPSGPRVLGVLLSIKKTYAALADMGLDPSRRTRLFFALVDARIILAALRAACSLAEITYPNDLPRLTLAVDSSAEVPGLERPLDGSKLFEWAADIERRVSAAIDSLSPHELDFLPGHETLLSLRLLAGSAFRVGDRPLGERTLVMFDNVQDLTAEQRQQLLDTTLQARASVGIWIAERFEAMSTEELLSEGATEGRDYGRVIALERYWRSRARRFENLVINIADRRSRSAADSEIDSFAACLEATLDGNEWTRVFERAGEEVSARVRELAANVERYGDWVDVRDRLEGTPQQIALAWRTLEILIERERRKSQQAFDFALSPQELGDKDDAGARAAAELFLSSEYDVPYYFGPSRLAALAAFNIEQFLSLAGDAFEEIASASLIGRSMMLSAKTQQDIVRRAARRRWEEIPRTVRDGDGVRRFLEAAATFARSETYQPNAPYEAGVAGIAISMADRERLRAALEGNGDPVASRLASIIATAIAENLMEPVLNYKCKGQLWMVLHFNRLLCVQFGLPLQYGGWRERPLREIYAWMERGFRPRDQDKLRL